MPRFNRVSLIGAVSDFPSVKTNKAGKTIEGAVTLLCMHGKRDFGEKQRTLAGEEEEIRWKGYNPVTVVSPREDIIETMKRLQPYDLVEVEGVVRVEYVKKKCYCPECDAVNKYHEYRTTVYPLFLMKRTSTLSAFKINIDDATEDDQRNMKAFVLRYLKKVLEKSNVVTLMGAICQDPGLYIKDMDSTPVLTFPLGVYREYFSPEDDMTLKTDVPYIKMYGKYARREAKILSEKNFILVDGFMQTRQFTRRIECEKCMTSFPVLGETSEVAAYEIEHLYPDVSNPPRFPKKGEESGGIGGGGVKAEYIGSEGHLDVLKKQFAAYKEGSQISEEDKKNYALIDEDIIEALIEKYEGNKDTDKEGEKPNEND